MLPNLSNTCKLQLLIPVSIEPAWMSARRQALLQLKTIVDVRVSSRTDKSSKALYTVEVFRNSVDNNDSPTSVDPVANGGRPLKVAVRSEKTLTEFGLLRGDIYDTAWSAHNNAHCAFCAELVELYVLGSANPEALTLRLLGEERALRKLTKLLNDLLTLTVRNSSADGRGVCSGQAHIPQLLFNFLFDRVPEEAPAA
ncbi:hypothetical protein PRIC1_001301 [Phytophthora ramorum]|uniref:Uncharacterized protein n=1 Tax=Phytophthora ramorum TaxID=164328 RepID=H3GQ26_PHYRM|nr:hypothetical protein KRP23_7954 [Phytophthora ramorum]KAH7508553.1 hypothetical protein KRP22_67 [Phytophthora ramorum]